jgi:hypothetical protein
MIIYGVSSKLLYIIEKFILKYYTQNSILYSVQCTLYIHYSTVLEFRTKLASKLAGK